MSYGTVAQWDSTTTSGPLTDGTGIWDTVTSHWTPNSGTTVEVWTGSSSTAIFGGGVSGTAGTVTVSGTIPVANISFIKPFSGQYTLYTGTINLGSSINVSNNASPTISAVISGNNLSYTTANSSIISLTSGLTLSGINTNTGNTSVSGYLSFSADSNLGATSTGLTLLNNAIIGMSGTFSINSSRSITIPSGNTAYINGGTVTFNSPIYASGAGLTIYSSNLTIAGVGTNIGTLTQVLRITSGQFSVGAFGSTVILNTPPGTNGIGTSGNINIGTNIQDQG